MTKRFDIGYHISEGFRAIFTHGLMSFAAVCMIVACLLIMGSFSLVALNLDHQLGRLERDNEFLAYVDEDLNDEQIAAIQPVMEGLPNVSTVTFVSREQALEDYVAELEESEMYQDLPENILRHRYRIHVIDIEQMETTVRLVEQVGGVAKISAALEIAKGFVAVRNIATVIAGTLIALLLLVSLFIISNTIRLATFYRRDEIAIMKMCGATNWFIRWPFLFEGMLLGLMGAVIAFALQWGVYAILSRAILEFGAGLLDMAPFQSMAWYVLGIFSGTGLVIGVVGSLLAIRKFLQV